MGNQKFKEEHKKLGLCLSCSEPVYRNGSYCKKHSFSNARATNEYYKRNRERLVAELREKRKRKKEEANVETPNEENAEEL
jgi:hypothetical protein